MRDPRWPSYDVQLFIIKSKLAWKLKKNAGWMNECLGLGMTKLAVWAEMNIFLMLNFPLVTLNTVPSLCSESQWSASGSLPEPKSTLEVPASENAPKWSWWTWMFYGINLLLILDLKLNLFKNWDIHNCFTFDILFEWPCRYLWKWWSKWQHREGAQ